MKTLRTMVVLSSHAPVQSKEALENLLFFNPRQHLARDGILVSLQRFGQPRIVETESGLSIRVENAETQTLFAFDRQDSGDDPIGLIVYTRTSVAEIVIIHLAVHPDFETREDNRGVGFGVTLVEMLREIVARIAGVSRLTLLYPQRRTLRVVSPHRMCPAGESAGSR